MATEIVTITPWDLGTVEQALKKIRGIAVMGSSTDDFPDVDDMRWVMQALHEIAHEAIQLIEKTKGEPTAAEAGEA